jgi:hypothetical protein
MTNPHWTANASISEIKRLTAKGMLGFYTHVEATEIVAFPEQKSDPINLFTLLVAEERPASAASTPHFLNPSRIRVPSIRDWSFGICRYVLPLDRLLPAYERLVAAGVWDASGSTLRQGAAVALPPQFVPPDSLAEIPWNRVLKNNFWNGCYIVEWADAGKDGLDRFFAAPPQLQALSDAINKHIPIRLASLSDRLGNIALQLPVTVLMARFIGRQDGNMLVETGWHPHAQARPLHASIEMEFDEIITGFRSGQVTGEQTLLQIPPGPGTHRGILRDDANNLMLAATGTSAFIRTIAMNMQPIAPEPRVFTLPDVNGVAQTQRVRIHNTLKSVVGASDDDGIEGWTRRRMYRDETSRLVRERRFVQYRPQPGQQEAEHQKALNDIRHLIAQYGEDGAWLWDPYLNAADILKTLFFSPHGGSDLRGLTAKKEIPDQSTQTVGADFFREQRDTFARAQSNFYGMRLEYRAKVGPSGWDFHDRFLILPQNRKGALAWSLGTSINSLGKAHHILQRVDDGQQVMDAFVALWNELDKPEHLVWKAPPE